MPKLMLLCDKYASEYEDGSDFLIWEGFDPTNQELIDILSKIISTSDLDNPKSDELKNALSLFYPNIDFGYEVETLRLFEVPAGVPYFVTRSRSGQQEAYFLKDGVLHLAQEVEWS